MSAEQKAGTQKKLNYSILNPLMQTSPRNAQAVPSVLQIKLKKIKNKMSP